MKVARALVIVSIFIALSGVVIHVGAWFAGLSWFTFFHVPARVVESYKSGTWLAPVSCFVIAGLMAAAGRVIAGILGIFTSIVHGRRTPSASAAARPDASASSWKP